MASATFNTTKGQTIDREQLAACINTGTYESPVWSILGTRVEDSSMEYDYGSSTIQDIRGINWTTLKKPMVSESFDPAPLDSGEDALIHIWGLAVKDQDAQSLSNQDILVLHKYADFAERYPSSAIDFSTLGGEGGGHIDSGFDINFGGAREKGTYTITSDGTITFTVSTT